MYYWLLSKQAIKIWLEHYRRSAKQPLLLLGALVLLTASVAILGWTSDHWIIGGITCLCLLALVWILCMHFAIVFSDARQMEIELRFAKEESAAAERAAVLHQQQYKKLLGQILPEQIAQELLRTGSCKPKKHASVSVLFADLVGFSEIASKWPPEKLIQELDECFWAFDQIMARHGLEKLKTIGDGYMAASGLMTPDDKHAEHAVLAAMEMSEYIGTKKRFWEETYNEPYWDVRIGINSGPVMAGIIGKRKFSYDIWGDTVNVASRMEQNSPVGKVSVSEASRSLLSDMFVCSQREAIHVKGKGLMRPFIIVGCKLKKNTPSAGSARAE